MRNTKFQNLRWLTNITLLLYFILFNSCESHKAKTPEHPYVQNTKSGDLPQPNYNYTVIVPNKWKIHDTTMQDGLKVRYIISPDSLSFDNPVVNILIAHMNGRYINDFTERNMNYLKKNLPGVILLEKGDIDSSAYFGRWFTYTREQDGVRRDMINYIIPLDGFAYMITCGVNEGNMPKYRLVFDKIAKSFKG